MQSKHRKKAKPVPLAEDPHRLAQLRGWSEEVYRDFRALQSGEMSRDEFRAKYMTELAILNLDITGFTEAAITHGQIDSLLRIFDVQKVVVPVLEAHGATLIRAFADDLVALFRNPDAALDAALAIHERVAQIELESPAEPPKCCIGIGWGRVYAIGPNLAQGDEMNRAAKLGEDIARGGETLLTENAFAELDGREDVRLTKQVTDDLLFPYFRVERL